MRESKLVDALRSGKELEILVALFQSADELVQGVIHGLLPIARQEAHSLIQNGDTATRLTLTYHPADEIRTWATRTIKVTDLIELEGLLRTAIHCEPAMERFTQRLGLAQHRNGYIREVALRAIAPGERDTLVTLLNLAADWVSVIARMAGGKARTALATATDEELFQAFPIIYGHTLRQRMDLSSLVNDYLSEVGRRPGLTVKIRRGYRWGKIGLWGYHVFGGKSEGILDSNALVQLEAAKQLVNDPNQWPKLMASRLPTIRRMGLDVAPAEARETALLDPHAGVRNDARFLLGKRDYAVIYRARLPALGAISGLGETGSKADAKLLSPLLFDERTEIRRRALESYARLLGDEAATELLVALQDPSSRVRRAAALGLSGITIALEPAQIVELRLGTATAWALMERCARWPALLAVLENREAFPRSDAWLLRWASGMRGRPFPPSTGQAETALALLRKSGESVNGKAYAELENALQAWVPK
jgi:hypothetical protein